ncbi:hypothetical protein [Streptomyces collinus]|uniref:hypothetical protein n=1 Tax=Streptomyces collinus TaxID=42684 RepID=UPI0033189599
MRATVSGLPARRVSRRLPRAVTAAVAVCAALTVTSGCTVPVDAVAGISVTADGRLLGVMLVCGHRIDGATLYVDSDDSDRAVTVRSWTADRPVPAGLTTWSLESPSPGWRATRWHHPLTPRTSYALYGWTKDNSWSSGDVVFTLADRDRLIPGRVRYDRVSADGDESGVTVSLAEFKRTACQER